MRLVSFDAIRSHDIPGVTPFKPEELFKAREAIEIADWVLFPEYWQVNALVYAWKKRIFPSINSYHLGHDKIELTRALQAMCPAHVPQTLILPRSPLAEEQILDQMYFPFVAKVPRSSMGKGVFLLEDRSDLRRYLQANEILYLQEYLPINRDLRVVVIGQRIVSAYWREAAPGSFHNNIARGGTACFDPVPEEILRLVLSVAGGLGINHAGFDLAVINGHAYFLEFNVRFGTQVLNGMGIRLGPLIFETLVNDSSIPPLTPPTTQLPVAS